MSDAAIEVFIAELVEQYDGSALQMLMAADQVLRLVCHEHPRFVLIAEDFHESIERYRSGDSKTFDDAFDCHRKKHWRQADFQYFMKHGIDVYFEMQRLRDNGESKTSAATKVGHNRGKDKDRIVSIYEQAGDWIRAQESYERELKEKYENSPATDLTKE